MNMFSHVAWKAAAYRDKLTYSAFTFIALASIGSAHAEAGPNSGSGFGIARMATNAGGNLDGLGKFLLGGAFLGGVGIAGTGIMKIKKAADSEGRESYAPGVMRLGVGGALVGLPMITKYMSDTLYGNDTGMSSAKGGVTFGMAN